jgi:hypothetical protein
MADPTYHLALTASEVIALSVAAAQGPKPTSNEERRVLLSALKKLLAVAEGLPELANG